MMTTPTTLVWISQSAWSNLSSKIWLLSKPLSVSSSPNESYVTLDGEREVSSIWKICIILLVI